MSFACELGFHDWKRAYLSKDSCKIVVKCARCGVVKSQTTFHKWEWVQQTPCLSQQVCKRCGAISEIDEKEHKWERNHISFDSCDMQEKCSLCGVVKEQIVTVHNDWEWVQRTPCLSQRVCKRCGKMDQIDEKDHDWRIDYIGADSCKIQEKCTRCGTVKGETIEAHNWGWVQQTPCISQQVCKRCGAIGKTTEKEHQWIEIYKPSSYELQKTCELCGATSIHPSGFSVFVGQDDLKRSLMMLVVTAKKRRDVLHHLLLCGQSGIGKITLAKIIAVEMEVNYKVLFGQTIEKDGNLATIFTNLRAGDVLIIEQIDVMKKRVLEVLVSALTDSAIDIVMGKGYSARNIHLKLPRFTCIGTTSNPSQVDKRLRSLMFEFSFNAYDKTEMHKIMSLLSTQQDGANILNERDFDDLMAELSISCPGEAAFLFRKLQEYKIAYSGGITPAIASVIFKDLRSSLGPQNNSNQYERFPIPDDVKTFVWQRDRGRCVKCGSQENLEYDHIIPISKGGSNTARNIQLLCEKCNRSKGANLI